MRYLKNLLLFPVILIGFSNCFNDLNTIPLDPLDLTSDVLFENPENYKLFLARLYAGLAVTGQEGPAGQGDISGIDEGFGQYLRLYFYQQELSTDEALIAWNDATIQDFHTQTWTPGDGFIFAFYSRVFYQISICNEFLRETTEAKLNERGVSANLKEEIKVYRAEARFLRALSYWHALDNFRNVPFVTEKDAVGAFFPDQTNANDLFSYIESELKEIETILLPPRSNEYARADQAAAWMLLAKLYLNAEVYLGQNRYQESLQWSERVLNAGYQLEEEYSHLFLADNHKSREIVFPIAFDGNNTRTYGGTTFIINASLGGAELEKVFLKDFGVATGWAGLRTTPEFFDKFPAGSGGLISAPNPGRTASYRKLYVPGTHQGNNPTDLDNSLSAPIDNNLFEGHVYFPNPNSEIRFYTIPSNTAPPFAIFGSNNNDGSLQQNGGPILVEEAGLHFISANLSNNTYTIQKRDFKLVGTAVPGGEADLEWDPATRTLVADLDLIPGTLFVQDNRDASVFFGDAEGSGILKLGEEPIQKVVDEARHIVRFFLSKPDYTYQINSLSFDRRPLFFTKGQTIDIEDVNLYSNGVAVVKFRNVTSEGLPGSNASFVDTDFPMFRLADAYLMAAEAAYRQDNASLATQYINQVRQRAFKGSGGNIAEQELDLGFILDERGRELYWECHRRSDLIRFGQFTDGEYLWQWKGGVKEGSTVGAHRNVYPLPIQDLGANPKLRQNEGY
jgi:hypothetical protein